MIDKAKLLEFIIKSDTTLTETIDPDILLVFYYFINNEAKPIIIDNDKFDKKDILALGLIVGYACKMYLDSLEMEKRLQL